MGAQHTPGPWAEDGYDVTSGRRRFVVARVEHISISRAWQDENDGHWGSGGDASHRDVPDDERVANARLIAAAPTMLDALRDLCTAYAACNGEDHPAYNAARRAIAKAAGEDA